MTRWTKFNCYFSDLSQGISFKVEKCGNPADTRLHPGWTAPIFLFLAFPLHKLTNDANMLEFKLKNEYRLNIRQTPPRLSCYQASYADPIV